MLDRWKTAISTLMLLSNMSRLKQADCGCLLPDYYSFLYRILFDCTVNSHKQGINTVISGVSFPHRDSRDRDTTAIYLQIQLSWITFQSQM